MPLYPPPLPPTHTPASRQHAAPHPSRLLPLLLAVSVFMQMLDATILNTALPQIAADLQEEPLKMQSAVISYALTLAMLMPLSGYLCDRFGTKKVFQAALMLFTAGSVLCAAADNLLSLSAARVIQGMGGAMLMPVPRLIILRAYPKTELLGIMNYVIMPALLGPLLGPVAGGYLVEYAGWHWIFLINVPVGVIGLYLAQRIMPDFYAADGKTPVLDVRGFLWFAAAAVSLGLAVEGLHYPDFRIGALVCALFGATALTAYIRHASLYGSHALYPLQLALIRTFRIGIIGNLASRLGMASVPFLMPVLLQVAFGRTPSESGVALAPTALAALLTKPLIKPLVERFGYRRILIWNTRLIGLWIMSLSLLQPSTPIWMMFPLLFALGTCNSLHYSSMNSLTLADLRPVQTGSGNSFMAVNQQLAIGLGIAFGALLLNLFSGSTWFSGSLHRAFQATFVLTGFITLCSSWVFARLHNKDGSNLTAA